MLHKERSFEPLEFSIGDVEKIQRRLKTLNLYKGPIDGLFGGGTEAAVKLFQKSKKLTIDGKVGPTTWEALFNEKLDKRPLKEALEYKCLALTGSIETGQLIPECFSGLSGNFDGQGISYGALQWNFGQESLQPLLKEMYEQHPTVMAGAFHEHLERLMTGLERKDTALAFAANIQHSIKHYVYEPWKGMFKALGRLPEFQQIEVTHAKNIFQKALEMCADYSLWSERGVALMFDMCVQNGSVSNAIKSKILASYKDLKNIKDREHLEVKRMEIIINHRLTKVNARWVEDVKNRKYVIAAGEGVIHGISYNLASQFDIKLEPFNG